MKTWTDEQLVDAVKTSKKYIEVALKLGLTNLGSNYRTIQKYIKKLNLDTSHFMSRSQILQEARKSIKEISMEELFAINSIDRKHIKNIIMRNKLLPYKCNICDINTWQGQDLTLHLDHINGINNDNRLENLRFLCPNCHSLTDTYCTKTKLNNKLTKVFNKCIDCQSNITTNAKRCSSCNATAKEKISWPSDKELLQMVNETNYSKVAKILNVSANAIKKRLHSKGLLIK